MPDVIPDVPDRIQVTGTITFAMEVVEPSHAQAILTHVVDAATQMYPHNLPTVETALDVVAGVQGVTGPPRYRSKPSEVEALKFDGDLSAADMDDFCPGKWRLGLELSDLNKGKLTILAGKDGAQDWVPVPEGHYIVRQPGDDSDIWPVDPEYFENKYGSV